MRRMLMDAAILIGASVVMVFLAALGARVLFATPSGDDTPSAAEVICLDEPMASMGGVVITAHARLCLTVSGTQATVQLARLQSGALYSAWLAYLERPRSRRAGQCVNAGGAVEGEIVTPARITSDVADLRGEMLLGSTLTGLHPKGDTQIEILVVDHGRPSAADGPARTPHLLAWDPAWPGLAMTPVSQKSAPSRLVGCATFWLRGGVDTLGQ